MADRIASILKKHPDQISMLDGPDCTSIFISKTKPSNDWLKAGTKELWEQDQGKFSYKVLIDGKSERLPGNESEELERLLRSNQEFIYGPSEKAPQDSTDREHHTENIQPKRTVGDGDCLLHAIFGASLNDGKDGFLTLEQDMSIKVRGSLVRLLMSEKASLLHKTIWSQDVYGYKMTLDVTDKVFQDAMTNLRTVTGPDRYLTDDTAFLVAKVVGVKLVMHVYDQGEGHWHRKDGVDGHMEMTKHVLQNNAHYDAVLWKDSEQRHQGENVSRDGQWHAFDDEDEDEGTTFVRAIHAGDQGDEGEDVSISEDDSEIKDWTDAKKVLAEEWYSHCLRDGPGYDRIVDGLSKRSVGFLEKFFRPETGNDGQNAMAGNEANVAENSNFKPMIIKDIRNSLISIEGYREEEADAMAEQYFTCITTIGRK